MFRFYAIMLATSFFLGLFSGPGGQSSKSADRSEELLQYQLPGMHQCKARSYEFPDLAGGLTAE